MAADKDMVDFEFTKDYEDNKTGDKKQLERNEASYLESVKVGRISLGSDDYRVKGEIAEKVKKDKKVLGDPVDKVKK